MSPTVAFIAANTFEFDSRHRRAAEALAADGWSVVVVGIAAAHLPDEETLPGGIVVRRPPVDRRILSGLPGPLRGAAGRLLGMDRESVRLASAGRFRGALGRAIEILAYRRRLRPWAGAAVAAAPEARLFVAKALVAVQVAAEAARRTGGRYVYDIADLHVESGRLAGLPGPIKGWLRRREARWIRGAAALLAVTPAMADDVARRHGVARPTVVLNARERWRPDEPRPHSTRLRDVADGDIVLYQGAFRPDQGIDVLLEATRGTPWSVVFLGFGPLEARLRAEPGVVVLPPVPSGELLEWTAGADVAFVGTPPVTRNQMLTTPNKLFEAAMAGVPSIVAGGTYTAGLVRELGLGEVVEPWTPAGVAAAIGRILEAPTAERDARRRAIRTVALDGLNWETERERLLETFRRLR